MAQSMQLHQRVAPLAVNGKIVLEKFPVGGRPSWSLVLSYSVEPFRL
jgi:hypothetical protein